MRSTPTGRTRRSLRALLCVAAWLGLASVSAAQVAPTPPTLILPARGDILDKHLVHFEWSSVGAPGTVHYHIVVFDASDPATVVQDKFTDATTADLLLFDSNWGWFVELVTATGAPLVPPVQSDTWFFQLVTIPNAPPDTIVTFPNGVDTAPPDVSVTGPNGGESFTGGDDITITWAAADDLTPSTQIAVRVYFSADGGQSWMKVIRTSDNAGSAVFQLPNITSDQCLIRVFARDHELKVGVDTSDAVFSVTANPDKPLDSISADDEGNQVPDNQFIKGESLIGGNEYAITWYTLDPDFTSTPDIRIVIDFSCDNGAQWNRIATLNDNPGAFPWTVPNGINSNECLVRVRTIDNGVNVSATSVNGTVKVGQDVSDSVFTITDPTGTPGPSTASSRNNVSVSSYEAVMVSVSDIDAPPGGPAGFTLSKAVSFGATGVTGKAGFTISFPSLPVDPVIYKVANGTWTQIFPGNQSSVTSVALSGTTLSYTVTDNSDADADPTVGAVSDPIVVGKLSAAAAKGSGGGCGFSGPGAGSFPLGIGVPVIWLLASRLRRRRAA